MSTNPAQQRLDRVLHTESDVARHPRPFSLERLALRLGTPIGLWALGIALAVNAGGAATPPADVVYAALGASLLLGLLLTVRLGPGRRPTSLVLIPLAVTWARVGALALAPLAWAAVLAALVRGMDGRAAWTYSGSLLLAGSASWSLGLWLVEGGVVGTNGGLILAVVLFPSLSWLISTSCTRLLGEDAPADLSDPVMPTLLAPLALLPLLAAAQWGDGALLLSLAALLAGLFVVRESINLATARAEIEQERGRLKRAYQLQEDLVQLITHDLRNPLTALSGYLRLLRRELPPGQKPAQYAERAEQAGQSMQRLVEALLEAGRLERAAELPDAVVVDLAAVAEQVRADLATQAEERQVLLSVECEADGPVEALGQPDLVRHAIQNLAHNAIKYTPAGGSVAICVRGGRHGVRPRVEVADTGVGITAEDQQRLFEKSFRSRDARVRGRQGLGLGLSLTRTMVERMGGRIWVESELDRGSRFYVELPPA